MLDIAPTQVKAPAVAATAVSRRYGDGESAVDALRGVTLEVPAGQFTAVMGPSGSGKSTLMHCLAGLDVLTSGTVLVGDTDLASLSDRERTLLRRDRLGFVFQSFNLLPTLTAEENITLPADLAGRTPDADWMATVVAKLDIADRLGHRPSELSGGQQQRVAVARALITGPDVVFADEPTGALDQATGVEVMRVLTQATQAAGASLVVVTHYEQVASWCSRRIVIRDGRVAPGEFR